MYQLVLDPGNCRAAPSHHPVDGIIITPPALEDLITSPRGRKRVVGLPGRTIGNNGYRLELTKTLILFEKKTGFTGLSILYSG